MVYTSTLRHWHLQLVFVTKTAVKYWQHKTNLVWLKSQFLQKVSGSDLKLQLDSGILKPVEVVHNLEVLLDTKLSMKQHITRIASNCFYHFCWLWQIRHVAGEDVTPQLISTFVLSRLDYWNSLLANLPGTSVKPLQWVQNAAARLVLNLGLHDHVTPALKQLHWTTCRTQNKIQVVCIDASNPHWACTVLGSLCAINRWIQLSTRSEVCRQWHRWLHQTSHSN